MMMIQSITRYILAGYVGRLVAILAENNCFGYNGGCTLSEAEAYGTQLEGAVVLAVLIGWSWYKNRKIKKDKGELIVWREKNATKENGYNE